MLRFGLIGCGRIGRLHAQAIAEHPGAALSVVHDIHAPAAAEIGVASGARVVSDVADLFGAVDVDAVLIASVTQTHADYIEAAVAAGKAVLCEKPIDLDLARVRRCAAAIAGTAVPIQIGFNRRFDPGHAALRTALNAGDIGDLLQVIITSRDPAPPPYAYLAGAGGMMRDMTIHDFDLARFLLGDDEPVRVFAVAGALIDPGIAVDPGDVDCATITMQTARGRQVVISNARKADYGYDQRVEALGTGGMLQSQNRRPHELRRFTATTADAGEPYLDFFLERYAEAFARQLDSFVAAVAGGVAPRPGFDDGLAALRLAEAAYRSVQTGAFVPVDAI